MPGGKYKSYGGAGSMYFSRTDLLTMGRNDLGFDLTVGGSPNRQNNYQNSNLGGGFNLPPGR